MGLLFNSFNALAAVLALAPYLVAAFFADAVSGRARRLPVWGQLLCPAFLSVPYALVACGAGIFRWGWFAVYALGPVIVAALLGPVGRSPNPLNRNPNLEPRAGWREFVVLAGVGLAVDLRWLEGAWPAHLAIFSKVLLLDAGIYGFVALQDLKGTGFDLRLRLRDVGNGLRELAWYTPIALVLGLSLGFLHLHAGWPGLGPIVGAWVFTFFFIAVPEELFFRGWLVELPGAAARFSGRAPGADQCVGAYVHPLWAVAL